MISSRLLHNRSTTAHRSCYINFWTKSHQNRNKCSLLIYLLSGSHNKNAIQLFIADVRNALLRFGSCQRTWAALSRECVCMSIGMIKYDKNNWINLFQIRYSVNPLKDTLKPQSNGPLYSNTVIGTLAVDGWAVTFGTARRGLGGLAQSPSRCTKCNSPPINGQCTNFILFDVAI